MVNPNGRLSKRKTYQLILALTILAWATHLLMHQWGFGAEVSQPRMQVRGEEPSEHFIAASSATRGANLELRAEASLAGANVKLKQICRWRRIAGFGTRLIPISCIDPLL